MQLRCITGIENNISQMVKIEENENLHPRKKYDVITQNGGLFRKFFLPETTYIKVS